MIRQGTILPIALMAFAIVSFLFLIDTAINPDRSKVTKQKVTVSSRTNTNQNSNENIVVRNGNFVTNENLNAVTISNTNEPFPTIEEDPVWEVKELFSEEFKTPYNNGDVSHLNCNDRYCIAISSSAGHAYAIVKIENETFTKIISFDAEDFEKPFEGRSAWNGKYWLIAGTIVLYKYDGTSLTKIALPDSNCSLQDIVSNGSLWMMATLCNAVNPWGKIYSFDGENFQVVSADYPGVTRIAWNGSVWAFVGQRVNYDNTTTNKAFFLTYNGTTFKDYSDKFTSMNQYSVSDVVWRDRWEIAYRPNTYDIESPLLYAFDNKTLTNISSTLSGFEKAQTGHLLNSTLYAVGGFKRPALNVVFKQKLLNLGPRLQERDVHSLAAFDKQTLLVGSNNGIILKIVFIQE